MLTYQTLCPGVIQLKDDLDVCMTLLVGEKRALLIDTGYGLSDLGALVRELIGPDRPLDVLLTHGHHDHALGARFFPGVWLFPEDRPVYETYTGERWRRRVLASAAARGLAVDEAAFLAAPMPPASAPPEGLDLGGLRVRILRVPGHTPGSACVLVEDRVLITGDDWNLTTWAFFPEAMGVRTLRENLRRLLALPFDGVICSHQTGLYSRQMLADFVAGLTDRALADAAPCGEGGEQRIDTVCLSPAPGQRLVFDRAKL